MYIVHVKRVTASEARRTWFRLLDEVAAGETVVVERNGRRILIQRESTNVKKISEPNYESVISGPIDEADTWGWEWVKAGSLRSVKKSGK